MLTQISTKKLHERKIGAATPSRVHKITKNLGVITLIQKVTWNKFQLEALKILGASENKIISRGNMVPVICTHLLQYSLILFTKLK
jgi:hypothetical protein